MGCSTLPVRVDLGIKAIKGYATPPVKVDLGVKAMKE